ncbi:MAG: hypothetical protein SCL54_17095 [Bacillota bacterium]|nr:hypothetical protein [Bacillota bacterium]
MFYVKDKESGSIGAGKKTLKQFLEGYDTLWHKSMTTPAMTINDKIKCP